MRSSSFICRIKNRLQSKAGFTLIETLIVAVIFTTICVSISASFVSGIKLWNRAKNTDFSKTNFLLEMEMLARQVRQLVIAGPVAIEGGADEVAFAAINGRAVVKVNYKFDPEEKRLIYTQTALEDIISGQPQQDKDTTFIRRNMLYGLEELSFSYFDRSKDVCTWAAAWAKEKGAFGAIRLTGRFKGEEFTKTIFIPAS